MAAGTTAAEASIPFVSGDNSVWADASPLLQHACNGLSSIPLYPMLEKGTMITDRQKLLVLGSADFQLLFPPDTGLQDGELVHGDNFNLYAAMSALEVLLLLRLWMVPFFFLIIRGVGGGGLGFISNLHSFLGHSHELFSSCHHFRVLQ